PSDRQYFKPPAAVPLLADATDTDGSISHVAFYNGANLLGIVTNPPYSLSLTGIASGVYPLTAIATDNEGATKTATVNVIVSNTPVFQFSRTNYDAFESNNSVVVTIYRNFTNSAASVSFQTISFSARAVSAGGIGNFYGVTNGINFNPGESSK